MSFEKRCFLGGCFIWGLFFTNAYAQLAIIPESGFRAPEDWNIGDINTTHQFWAAPEQAFVADIITGVPVPIDLQTPAFETVASPALNFDVAGTDPNVPDSPLLDNVSPGFRTSSGGYYSFSGQYGIFSDIYNQGGSLGTGGPYTPQHGTRVIVQTAALAGLTPDDTGQEQTGSVILDSVELVQFDGTPLIGGTNDDLISTEDLSLDEDVTIVTPIGAVTSPFQTLAFEFFLPNYTGDFRVEIDLGIHTSFQFLQVDTQIVLPADFNEDEVVTGSDFLAWQRGLGANDGTASPAQGDANFDGNIDEFDLAIFETQFGSGISSPILVSTQSIPEPSSLLLLMLECGCLAKLRRR